MKKYPEAVWKKLEEIELKTEDKNLLFELGKLVEQSPIKVGVDMYKGFILDTYACPKCGRPVGDDMIMFNYCPNCGQSIKRPNDQ